MGVTRKTDLGSTALAVALAMTKGRSNWCTFLGGMLELLEHDYQQINNSFPFSCVLLSQFFHSPGKDFCDLILHE